MRNLLLLAKELGGNRQAVIFGETTLQQRAETIRKEEASYRARKAISIVAIQHTSEP